MNSGIFDEDYYEHGVESRKSCYSNYRWIPELTIPMAMSIIDHMEIRKHQTILDFGCAKGYLVKAFRLLNRPAWGVDISQYAIDNADPMVKDYVSIYTPKNYIFDFCIAKDVFEHIPIPDLKSILRQITARRMFAVIPLGEGGIFRAPSNNMDITHCTCMGEIEWQELFADCDWSIESFSFRIAGIKDSYSKMDPTAHGFFTMVNQCLI